MISYLTFSPPHNTASDRTEDRGTSSAERSLIYFGNALVRFNSLSRTHSQRKLFETSLLYAIPNIKPCPLFPLTTPELPHPYQNF